MVAGTAARGGGIGHPSGLESDGRESVFGKASRNHDGPDSGVALVKTWRLRFARVEQPSEDGA